MKILMLWKYYPKYLKYFYERHPYVTDLSFEEHRNEIFDDHFSWPAELCRFINQNGIKAEFIIANAELLQKKWARENGFARYSAKNWEKEIAMEQVKRFSPDILWIAHIYDYFGAFVKEAVSYCKKAITWISAPLPEYLDITGLTTLITAYPDMLKGRKYSFSEIIVTKTGFNPEILKKIGVVEKKQDVVFVGQVTENHTKRAELLAYLIENGISLKVFGFLPERQSFERLQTFKTAASHILKHQDLQQGLAVLKRAFGKRGYYRNIEVIKSAYKGPVFGLDMYRTLMGSRIVVNAHIDIAENYAGNMRMFEATGSGACLLTEHCKNINELFSPGKEVLVYRSKEELLEIISSCLRDKNKVEEIAYRGQKKTLASHTMENMFNDIKPAFDI